MKMFLSVFIWFMLLASAVSANPYVSDKNFVYVYYNSYLDLRTVSVQKNSPPYFIVKGDIVHVDTKSNTASLYADITIKFDLLAHRTFHRNNKTGNWKLGNTFGTSSEETSNRKIADALFKSAFGWEFYGENFSRSRLGINESVPALSMNRLAIGGIQIGASFERVRSIYGSPNKVRRLAGRDLRFWSGNSGGPVINDEGSIIGVSCQQPLYSENTGNYDDLGYGVAVPIKHLYDISSKDKKIIEVKKDFFKNFE